MFSRISKGISSFIDEESERQKQQQHQHPRDGSSARRTPSNAGIRRGSSRGGASQRTPSRRAPEDKGDGRPATKGPDPDDFVIGDDASEISRAATPTIAIAKDGEEAATEATGRGEKQDAADGDKGKARAVESNMSPEEVQQKLAKLESLTTRYQDLLRNYRIAHASVIAIEPFEATLREHTPLTSISDPGALVEFLNQRNLQSDMLKDELKRISEQRQADLKERDELKVKLDEAEKRAKEAFDEAAGLRRERDDAKPVSSETTATKEVKPVRVDAKDEDSFFSYEDEVSRAEAQDQEHETQIQDLNATHETKIQELKVTHDTEVQELKTTHETEVTELKREATEQKDYINELTTELGTVRKDFDDIRLDLDAQENKVRTKDVNIASLERQLNETKMELENSVKAKEAVESQSDEAAASLATTDAECAEFQAKLKDYQSRLEESKAEAEKKAAQAQENLKKYQKEHEENVKNGKYVKREEKRLEVSQKLVRDLQGQTRAAENAKKIAETKVSDLEAYVTRLEAETSSASQAYSSLRAKGEEVSRLGANISRLEKALSEAEHERDDAQRQAQSKKNHESKVASLGSQLKRAEKDRDAAYQMILDCGKCSIPKKDDDQDMAASTEESTSSIGTRSRVGSETTDASTQPTDVSSETATPAMSSVDGGELAVPGKKSKKKSSKAKSKAKKKAASDAAAANELTVDDLLHDPELATEVMLKTKFGDNVMVPLVASMIETMKERTDAEGEHESRASHLEGLVEQSEQAVRDKNAIIVARNEENEELRRKLAEVTALSSNTEEMDRQIETLQEEIATLQKGISEKDARIDTLEARLRGEAALQDEIDMLREDRESLQEDVLEHGKAATDAKHELKEVTERRDKLQEEFDEVQKEREAHLKSIKEVQERKDFFSTRCASLEAEIAMLQGSHEQETNERVQNLEQEKEALRVSKEASEKQIEDLKTQHTASGTALDEKHKSLSADLDTLRSRSTQLEKDLAAANQLAQTRFKDLTDLREMYNRLQPELKKLRDESTELKTLKVEMERSSSNIKKLEARERDLKSEISEYKSRSVAKDSEIAALKDKGRKSDERSKALEESYETARKDLEKSESTRNEALEARDKVQVELNRAQDELKKLRLKHDDLDEQIKKATSESSRIREELQLKTAQHASSQSLMDSMQDQTRELATQMKELKEKNESLEEELGEAHRLLSERSREGETMRRLLADVEVRADAKVKEMRERMELAIEERDRAETDASTIGRKRAREVEELKTKLRDGERDLTRATEERQAAERREREFKNRQEDLERRAAQAQEEVNDMRTAMGRLRDTLDETEQQARDLEKEKQDLRRTLEEKHTRLEKLQKSSRSMAEELRTLQSASKNRQNSSATPSRSSIDTSRVMSPAPRASNGAAAGKDGSPGQLTEHQQQVLVQFLEGDKKTQKALVSVLGTMFGFEPQYHKKLEAAIKN